MAEGLPTTAQGVREGARRVPQKPAAPIATTPPGRVQSRAWPGVPLSVREMRRRVRPESLKT
jgi:hypothetical protein